MGPGVLCGLLRVDRGADEVGERSRRKWRVKREEAAAAGLLRVDRGTGEVGERSRRKWRVRRGSGARRGERERVRLSLYL